MGRVVVVGAGVVGLSCALRLLEAGHRVDVLARDLPRETTSAVAAAIWYPFRVGPQDKVLGWAEGTYGALAAIAEDRDSGVVLRSGTEVLSAAEDAGPWWAAAVPDLRETVEVPTGWEAGWTFTAPVVEMPRYLDWLAAQVREAGGSITRLNLHGLPRAGDGGPAAVVNCAGIGAKYLASDPSVHPVQGQVVLVEQVGLEHWWLDGSSTEGPTYVVARATSWSAAPTSRGSGAGLRHPRSPRRSCAGHSGWSRSWPVPRCSATRWGCDPPGPRCGWSGLVTSCTATATGARA